MTDKLQKFVEGVKYIDLEGPVMQTGQTADYIICDDPGTPFPAMSAEDFAKVEVWWKGHETGYVRVFGPTLQEGESPVATITITSTAVIGPDFCVEGEA